MNKCNLGSLKKKKNGGRNVEWFNMKKKKSGGRVKAWIEFWLGVLASHGFKPTVPENFGECERDVHSM